MDRPVDGLPHIRVTGRARNATYSASGRNDPKVRDVVDRRAHGRSLKFQTGAAFEQWDGARGLLEQDLQELAARGTFIVVSGAPGIPLELKSLDLPKSGWLLANVTTDSDGAEHAQVWVSDRARSKFLARFEAYATETAKRSGAPKHNVLVANIARVRRAFLRDLWTDGDEPRAGRTDWWEIWLRDPEADAALAKLEAIAERRNWLLAKRRFGIDATVIVWVRAPWSALEELLLLDIPVVEIRTPQTVETFASLNASEQREYVDDLAERLVSAPENAPAACILDTGVDRGHALIESSLSPEDAHTVVGTVTADQSGHGTEMAGLALFGGHLEEALASTEPVTLSHRLESVRFLTVGRGDATHEPTTYGQVTADAVAQPEITSPERSRVFSMAVTAPRHDDNDAATLWSATIDALAVGAGVSRDGENLDVISEPDPDASRLFVVSAGNVPEPYERDHLELSSQHPIEDPAHAFNVLTVGAFTNLSIPPVDPNFAGWSTVAEAGDLSPYGRTYVGANRPSLKPDVCLEGGNLLHDGREDFVTHPAVSVLTTARSSISHPAPLTHSHATSAATAQAARLAARVMADQPDLWPETVRALIVHSARWTDAMKRRMDPARGRKREFADWIRHFGWGVPDEARLLRSTRSAVTLISQDSFSPFDEEHRVTGCRIHDLPWPASTLSELGELEVRVRITLSYFVEPNARRRGWRQRYTYASHGLRFGLKRPLETPAQFVTRVTRAADNDTVEGADRWLVGPQARNRGSIHQDVWSGSAAELAEQGSIAVFATKGWWARNEREDRKNPLVRYALVVSIETDDADVDLYTPIVAQATVAAPATPQVDV